MYKHTQESKKYFLKQQTATKVSELVIKGEIGQGGFGKVFLAQSSSPNSGDFIIKQIEKKQINKQFLDMEIFCLEQSGYYLGCVHELTNDVESARMIMQKKMPGDSLINVIRLIMTENKDAKKGMLRPIKEIMLQLAWELDDLHKKGIIHCDIKPDNVMVAPVGEHVFLNIIDFGLASKIQQYTDVVKDTCRGSPMYMAPECFSESKKMYFKQAAKANRQYFLSSEYQELENHLLQINLPGDIARYSVQSDLYAFGLVCRQLMVCATMRIWNDIYASNDVDARKVCDIVAKMTALECEQRPSMQDIIGQLEQLFTIEELSVLKAIRKLNKTLLLFDVISANQDQIAESVSTIVGIFQQNPKMAQDYLDNFGYLYEAIPSALLMPLQSELIQLLDMGPPGIVLQKMPWVQLQPKAPNPQQVDIVLQLSEPVDMRPQQQTSFRK